MERILQMGYGHAVMNDLLDVLVERARARHLPTFGAGSVMVTVPVSSMLVLMVEKPEILPGLLRWLGVLVALTAIRLFDIFVVFRRRRALAFDGRAAIRRFVLGSCAVGLALASFPIVFFPALGFISRAMTFMVFFGLAGGAVTVLSPSLPLTLFYCSAVLLPGVVMALVSPSPGSVGMALFTLFGYAASIHFSRITHRAVVGGLRLNRKHRALTIRAEQQRRQAEAANRDLGAAQAALAEVNGTLERRVAERTAELAHEVAERERYADALSRLASLDPLTELYNRTTFNARLSALLDSAAERGSRVALLFVDLDNFKQINDLRGHELGDRVLQETARRVAERIGASGDVARWGGDEFLISIADCDGEEAFTHAEALIETIKEPLRIGVELCRLEASIGVALYPDDGKTADVVIRAADVAMYAAKREGRGLVKQFDPALADDMAERYALEQGLREAIDRDELRLVFQPIVTATDGRCRSFEALLRWDHSTRGTINPSIFIPIAEQSGQIERISRWVLREACRTAAGWSDRSIAVTVNISVAHVLVGGLVDDVEVALAASGLSPSRLKLEITETMFLHDHLRAAPVFDALRAKGIQILLDDFGTGFSSLSFLGKLPVDVIKIDRSFVEDASRNGYATIEAILSIARALGLQVTAEGVETAAQREKLAALGVQNLQGYLFSRPMPAGQVAAWLTQSTGGPDGPGKRTAEEGRTQVAMLSHGQESYAAA